MRVPICMKASCPSAVRHAEIRGLARNIPGQNLAGNIVVYRRDGMGARLRNLVAGLRLQQRFGGDLVVLWPVGATTKTLKHPDQLFDADFVAAHMVQNTDQIKKTHASARDFRSFQTAQDIQAHLAAGGSVLIENLSEEFLIPGEDVHMARAEFIQTAASLPFHVDILDRVQMVRDHAGGQAMTALHVRRGDIIFEPYWARRFWPTKYAPDEYYDVMIEQYPNRPYLLFSDTPQTISRFHDRHGIVSTAAVMDLASLSPAQADLSELLAISQCNDVLCSSYSAFSTAAVMMGGATKTALPDDLPAELQRKAHKRLGKRLQAGPEAFINVNDYGQSLHWQVQRSSSAEAQALCERVIDQRLWVPHLGPHTLTKAVRNRMDQETVALIETDQRHYPFRARYLQKTPDIKRLQTKLFLAAQAYVGLGDIPRAVEVMANIAMFQRQAGAVDALSHVLHEHLRAGAFGCPPTTLVPYSSEDGRIPGFRRLRDVRRPILMRFLARQTPWHWQAAMGVDWPELHMSGGCVLQDGILERLKGYATSDDPMEKSLAAVACLRTNRTPKARQLMNQIADPLVDLSGDDWALLQKRKAQVLLKQGKTQQAEYAAAAALEASAHPVFRWWWAACLLDSGQRDKALDVTNTLPADTQYARAIMVQLADPADVSARKKALEEGFVVTVPETGGNVVLA